VLNVNLFKNNSLEIFLARVKFANSFSVKMLITLLLLVTLDSNNVNFLVTITNWKKIKLHMIYIYGFFNP
jgi:hypothetical protein